MMPGLKRALKLAILPAGLALAAFLLHRILERYPPQEILASARAVPAHDLALAAACAALSYLCLTGFDWFALRYLGRRLPYPKVAFASFVALSIGHNVGGAALSSGAIRYRFYARWGLSGEAVAKLVLFCGLTVGLGLATLGGIALLLRQDIGMRVTGLEASGVALLGAWFLAFPAAYVALALWKPGDIRLWRWSIEIPGLSSAFAQLFVGTLNFLCVSGCLYFALRAGAELSFPDAAAAYVIANVTALISHVPGGLGVVESVVMFLVEGAGVIGGLVVFRLIYYVAPLPAGLALLLAFEARNLLRKRKPGGEPAAEAYPERP